MIPDLFLEHKIRPLDGIINLLLKNLRSLAVHKKDPVVVLLTPGSYNSAYFEHAFLAQQMGINLVGWAC